MLHSAAMSSMFKFTIDSAWNIRFTLLGQPSSNVEKMATICGY